MDIQRFRGSYSIFNILSLWNIFISSDASCFKVFYVILVKLHTLYLVLHGISFYFQSFLNLRYIYCNQKIGLLSFRLKIFMLSLVCFDFDLSAYPFFHFPLLLPLFPFSHSCFPFFVLNLLWINQMHFEIFLFSLMFSQL